MEVYNKNRDQNNSMHDEIREQNAKLKDAPFKEKLAYFKEYYLKMTLVAVATIGLIVYILVTTLTSPSDTAFAAYLYNDTGDISDTALIDGFIEHAQLEVSTHRNWILLLATIKPLTILLRENATLISQNNFQAIC